ncbi:hypothetical protein M673_24115 (plasmid) [Aureimonas sp. AU20]|nr:hypothetical protein M673_24115 [Aureimonas sp. AU20]
MSSAPKSETISLFALWKENREASRPFGEVCEMARRGQIPGALPVGVGTPVIMASLVDAALAAMRV